MSKTLTEKGIRGSNDWVLCELPKISLDDEFMKHTPCSEEERRVKELIKKAIKDGAREFHSRLLFERVTWCGRMIKKLLQNGHSVSEAWNAMCNDSGKLGHYYDSSNGNYEKLSKASIEMENDYHNSFSNHSVGWLVLK